MGRTTIVVGRRRSRGPFSQQRRRRMAPLEFTILPHSLIKKGWSVVPKRIITRLGKHVLSPLRCCRGSGCDGSAAAPFPKPRDLVLEEERVGLDSNGRGRAGIDVGAPCAQLGKAQRFASFTPAFCQGPARPVAFVLDPLPHLLDVGQVYHGVLRSVRKRVSNGSFFFTKSPSAKSTKKTLHRFCLCPEKKIGKGRGSRKTLLPQDRMWYRETSGTPARRTWQARASERRRRGKRLRAPPSRT